MGWVATDGTVQGQLGRTAMQERSGQRCFRWRPGDLEWPCWGCGLGRQGQTGSLGSHNSFFLLRSWIGGRRTSAGSPGSLLVIELDTLDIR